MIIFRVLTILVLIVGIFGTAAYYAYELYWKPQQLDREDKIATKAAASAPQAAPVDYSLPAFQRAVNFRASGDVESARGALNDFIRDFPDSPNLVLARRELGAINSDEFFSASPGPGKTTYTVASRDSLAKIAGKFKSSAELIFRVNNLDSINLQIGQQLFIPEPKITVVVDHKAKTVTLKNDGVFFKEYPAISVKAPSTAATETKVLDKFAMQGDKRVAFGEKNYAGADRLVMLSGGVTIRGLAEGSKPPPGIIVSIPDMDEIFLLVNRGTPVTLR